MINKEQVGEALVEAARISSVRPKSLETVKYLISKGADINHIDKFGMTALNVFVIMRNVDGVEFLLGNGANPNMKFITSQFREMGKIVTTPLRYVDLSLSGEYRQSPEALQPMRDEFLKIKDLLVKHGAK